MSKPMDDNLQVRANLTEGRVEITFLPSGTVSALTVEEAEELLKALRRCLAKIEPLKGS